MDQERQELTMKKLVVLVMAALAVGCGDDDGITLMDSGMGTDMGGAVDMGPTGTDMGPAEMDMGPRECEEPLDDLVDINMMAGGMLLPRCEAATADCLSACGDQACATACLTNDPTPGVDVGGGTTLDCNLCFNYQTNVCVSDGCPTEFAAFICCAEDNGCTNPNDCGACATEQGALNSCAQGLVSAGTCGSFQSACFAAPAP